MKAMKIIQKTIVLAGLLFFAVSNMHAQITYLKAYGNKQTWLFNANAICPDNTGGYMLAGQRYTPTTGSSDMCVMHVNDTGAVVWSNVYGGSNDEVAWDIKQTYDGNFIIAGSTKSVAGAFDMYVLKIDTAGGVLQTKVVGGPNLDIAYCIQPTADSGFVIAGRTQSFGAGNEEFYVVKLGSTLAIEWSRTLGTTNPDYASWVEQLPDNGYITSGYSIGAPTGWEFLLMRLDSAGNVLWKKNYGTTADDYAYCVKPDVDGNFIVAGDQTSSGASVRKPMIAKIDPLGSVLWYKTFSTSGFGKLNSVLVQDDGYVFTGYVIHPGQADVLLIKTDFNGDTLFVKAIGMPTAADYGEKVIAAVDGGLAIAGYTAYPGNYGNDFLLVKTDSMGNVGCYTSSINPAINNEVFTVANFGVAGSGAAVSNFTLQALTATVTDTVFCAPVLTSVHAFNSAKELFHVSPNPVGSSLTLYVNSNGVQSCIRIYDMLGYTVYEKQQASGEVVLSLNKLKSGMYIAEVMLLGHSQRIRFVKE